MTLRSYWLSTSRAIVAANIGRHECEFTPEIKRSGVSGANRCIKLTSKTFSHRSMIVPTITLHKGHAAASWNLHQATNLRFAGAARTAEGVGIGSGPFQTLLGYLIVLVLTTLCITSAAQATEVLVGAGDIAECDSLDDEATAALLDDIPGTVFTLGDNTYETGSHAEFNDCYDLSWGRHKARTKPAIGNHEYLNAGAAGYWNYFGEVAGPVGKGYYAYDLGSWRIYVLNSMCQLTAIGGCGPNSPMVNWLRENLAANPTQCALAYFHHSLFSSGKHGGYPKMRSTWDALYNAGVDVIVSAHDHGYERFAPQTPDGELNYADGIRLFIVGTGGAQLAPFATIAPNSRVRQATSKGVLKLTLTNRSYQWQFVPLGAFTDSGTALCH